MLSGGSCRRGMSFFPPRTLNPFALNTSIPFSLPSSSPDITFVYLSSSSCPSPSCWWTWPSPKSPNIAEQESGPSPVLFLLPHLAHLSPTLPPAPMSSHGGGHVLFQACSGKSLLVNPSHPLKDFRFYSKWDGNHCREGRIGSEFISRRSSWWLCRASGVKREMTEAIQILRH